MSPPPSIRAPLRAAAVRIRRFLVRRPWVHWAIVGLAATGAAATALDRADDVDAARRAWGTTRTVFVASRSLEPGDAVAYTATDLPAAMVGEQSATADELDTAIARQWVAEGEVISTVDVTNRRAPASLIPDGWLGVPVLESPPSGAALGDRVRVASGGIVIGDDAALVIGHIDGATLLAVPLVDAPLIAAAADADGVTLLLDP